MKFDLVKLCVPPVLFSGFVFFSAFLFTQQARADITYDVSSFAYKGSIPYELTFTVPDFLTSTTSIPLADLNIITQPSPCSFTGFQLDNPSSSTVRIEGDFTGTGCPVSLQTTDFSGPFDADGTYSGEIDNSTVVVSGSPETSAVPEPSSVFLFATIGLTLLAVGIRKRGFAG